MKLTQLLASRNLGYVSATLPFFVILSTCHDLIGSCPATLPPRTCHVVHVRAAATWEAVIGHPLPRVSKWDPLDMSQVTCAGQRVNRSSQRVNGSGQQFATCHHLSGSRGKPCGIPRG
ncbi:hypothetical protein Tco_1397353 [Tanacetum coccineum]